MNIISTLQNFSTALSADEQATIRNELAAYLNHLLLNDFSAVVQILYRVDVSEQRLKQVLQDNQEADAGELVADLIIERQLQKIDSRSISIPDADIPDEERW